MCSSECRCGDGLCALCNHTMTFIEAVFYAGILSFVITVGIIVHFSIGLQSQDELYGLLSEREKNFVIERIRVLIGTNEFSSKACEGVYVFHLIDGRLGYGLEGDVRMLTSKNLKIDDIAIQCTQFLFGRYVFVRILIDKHWYKFGIRKMYESYE